jgi:2-polyprenyl-6-methoxyphenol hydroxylase-like FAD-dependent oxidoreductase
VQIAIVGGGIGGLTLALMLHEAGLSCTVFEAASEIRPLGVGINILPNASKELCRLGLDAALARAGVLTQEAVFFNRFGQRIYTEPLGRAAGYQWPQFSIHRGDLQLVLLDAAKQRLGADRVVTGWRCLGVDQNSSHVTVRFEDTVTGAELTPCRADVAVACDGIHSVVRKQLHPDEGDPLYSGINMWRGVSVWPPILSGASMIRAGWFTHGKMVIYPIRNNVDGHGRQLVNWAAEIQTPKYNKRDWNRPGLTDDFLPAFRGWRFDWLDVPALIESTDRIYEYPMVDQDALPWWSSGRVTLLGDAAHPMVPRGSNGAGQAILDGRVLTDCLVREPDPVQALKAYEDNRLPATAAVVRMNRLNPPDAIIREVHERTGDKPFDRIEDVISPSEFASLLERYKRVAGYDHQSLGTGSSGR